MNANQIVEGQKNTYLNKLQKTRLVGLLSIVGLVFTIVAIIILVVGIFKSQQDTTIVDEPDINSNMHGFIPRSTYYPHFTEPYYKRPNIYEYFDLNDEVFIGYLIAFYVIFFMSVIYDITINIIYIIMIVRLNEEKFKTWIILYVVGLCVVPILYLVAWIYTLIQLKWMINKEKIMPKKQLILYKKGAIIDE
ncbi:hypothetical protein OF376_00020 [Ureaplasma miroungigenitalium]|uniref:Uncharacterized protein n=1 Tax=Ureaplasma miroungigenitalium TaxID=1042321 RepID=A0ABT3BLM7_9BACT|nr:hypothetical protein [Ureaplasma miroungigenitalium]MCV3728176.1 hypothetical protein [Ureaplasma miroungigenitalium]MCV3733980.1 hypothetical protein [Ureaplasma miroungigenitalium]